MSAVDNRHRIAIRTIGVAITLILAVGCLQGSTPAPLAAVKAFFGAIERRDYDTAYELFHSDLRQLQSFEEFTSLAKTHSLTFDAGYRQWSTDTEGDSAVVEGQLTTESGYEATVSFRLVNQDGDWQIVEYQLRDESGIAQVGQN